jgi:hypothetical protein
MTLVLIVNAVLAVTVLSAVLGVVAWAIIHSHHEGRAVTVASRRQWVRPTISLHRASPHSTRRARPFRLELDV